MKKEEQETTIITMMMMMMITTIIKTNLCWAQPLALWNDHLTLSNVASLKIFNQSLNCITQQQQQQQITTTITTNNKPWVEYLARQRRLSRYECASLLRRLHLPPAGLCPPPVGGNSYACTQKNVFLCQI